MRLLVFMTNPYVVVEVGFMQIILGTHRTRKHRSLRFVHMAQLPIDKKSTNYYIVLKKYFEIQLVSDTDYINFYASRKYLTVLLDTKSNNGERFS